MSAKVLLSGLANSGKTKLLSTLQNGFVMSHDGKRFALKIPHININEFADMGSFIDTCNSAAEAYKAKVGNYPETIVIDSVSRVFTSAYNALNVKFNGDNFKVYAALDREIKLLTDYLEDIVNNGISLVIISHSIFDEKTARYSLVDSGKFGKLGGFLSVVDFSIFVEVKGKKRSAILRDSNKAARCVLSIDEVPESMPITIDGEKPKDEDFNLQDYINLIKSKHSEVEEFEFKL
mgnify:CR=1 FL=1